MENKTPEEYLDQFIAEMIEIFEDAVKRVNSFNSASTFVKDVDAMQKDIDKAIDNIHKKYSNIPTTDMQNSDIDVDSLMDLRLGPATKALEVALKQKTQELVGNIDE